MHKRVEKLVFWKPKFGWLRKLLRQLVRGKFNDPGWQKSILKHSEMDKIYVTFIKEKLIICNFSVAPRDRPKINTKPFFLAQHPAGWPGSRWVSYSHLYHFYAPFALISALPSRGRPASPFTFQISPGWLYSAAKACDASAPWTETVSPQPTADLHGQLYEQRFSLGHNRSTTW